jgi:4-hydroxy-tetrahydrodipicolinate reductase
VKIGLLGYGKMGKAIEKVALLSSFEIVWRITRENRESLTATLLQEADVVIEFSQPESAYDNVMLCLKSGIPVVCGTTGWPKEYLKAKKYCEKHQGAMLCSSNFSIGVNIFFEINRNLAKMMSKQKQYNVKLSETHHIHKLDAPSGTAVTLANDIIAENPDKKSWVLSPNKANREEISITSIREDEVPGTHSILWQSEIDEISIEHKAHTREGFAKGAVLAASWLIGKKGVFEMKDVLFND